MPQYHHVSALPLCSVWKLQSMLSFRGRGENLMLLFNCEHDIHKKLTSTWQVSVNTNNQCLPLDKAQRLCFEKQNLSHISIDSNPAALRLSSLSLWDCFSLTCSCQIPASCHLSVVNRPLRKLGPRLRVVAAVVEGLTEYEELTSFCNLISFSSVSVFAFMSLSSSGTWVSVTVGRCWPMEEPRSQCWWWKVI